MNRSSRSIINVACSLIVLVTNVVISFWLSPFVIEHIGIEANGFVTLANNFVMYAALITGALNSMAARFITIEYVNKDYNKANLYYNSIFWGKLIVVSVLLLPAVYLIVRLDNLVVIPSDIMLDVKVLFSFIFMSFFINSSFPNWECGTYVTNRLDRDYLPNMATTVMRCLIIFMMMTILVPKVWYIGFASCITSILLLIVRGDNTHKLTPYLRLGLKKGERQYSWIAVKELTSSGIWNSISQVGILLLLGLDLILCNLYLGATAMGVVALSKIFPNYMSQLSGSVQGAFGAELTINYAKGNMEDIYRDINKAMKITSFIIIVPIACIVVFGYQFFTLWVPSQDAYLLQTLSVLATLGYMFTSGTQILYNVFSTVNKVKQNAIAILISGVCSMFITIILVKFTDLGIYAVAGVSTFVNLVRNMSFTLPQTAMYLGFNWKRFFPQVLQTVFTSIILISVGYLVKPYLPVGSWFALFVTMTIFATVAFTISWFILLNKSERRIFISKISNKIKR